MNDLRYSTAGVFVTKFRRILVDERYTKIVVIFQPWVFLGLDFGNVISVVVICLFRCRGHMIAASHPAGLKQFRRISNWQVSALPYSNVLKCPRSLFR